MTRIFVGTSQWRGTSRPGTGALYMLDTEYGDWQQIADVPANGVQAITTDIRTGTIFVGTRDGIYRSDDQGAHWQRAGSGTEGIAIWSILIHPGSPDTILAGAGPRAIYRSQDGGETWVPAQLEPSANIFNFADDGVTLLPFAARVTGLTVDATRPEIIYASVEVEGVLRSDDFGATWRDCSRSLIAMADEPHLAPKIGVMDGRKSMADGHAIVAHDQSLFYANRLGLFRSEDHGETWNDVRLDRVSPLTYVRSIVGVANEPGIFYATLGIKSGGDDGTIWKSSDAGESWVRFDQDISPDSTLMALAVHASRPEVVFATGYSGQLVGTEDGGRTWRTWCGPEGATESFALACI